MKKNYYKLIPLLATVFTLMLVLPPGTVYAQWSIYDGSASPESITPRPFVRATNNFVAPDNFDNHNVIVSEPNIPSNNLLRMSNTVGGTQFLWRMNFAAHSSLPAIAVTNLTLVMRVRGHSGPTHTLDVDIDYNTRRSRLSLTTATRLMRIRNGTGTNASLPVAPTEWVIYRFAMTATETRVFINENPTPIMTFTPASGTQNHFRFGDGDGAATLGADIDWVIWDISGSYAPGEGTSVPFADLTPQWGIRLSDLQVVGATVAGFHPAVVHYEVILPPDAVNPPLVAANAQLASSTVVITQATAIPGTATIAVTSEDGVTTRTYSVHFRKLSSNASLATLTVGGTPLAGFNPEVTTYDIVLPAGTTAAPTIAATVAELTSTLVITQATAVPGTGTVLVTAEDGTTRTYTINFRHPSTNANLASLMVGGTAIAGFSPTVTTYEVALPPATTVAPTVTATAADARATVVITQAAAIPGAATVRVTAEDGTTTVTYTINFRLQSTNANLTNLLVDGTTVPGFAPTTITYNIVLPWNTTIIPVVSAILDDSRASMVVTQASALPGSATVVVTAEDGVTARTYTINFSLAPNNWTSYDGSVMPNVLTPRPFMTAMSPFDAAHNAIIDEPLIPGNKLLRMNNTAPATQFKWRMNFAAFGTAPDPTFPAIDVTNLTIVVRARGHADRTHALDLDIDYNGERSRLSVTTATRLARIRNGTGPANVRLPVAPTEWVIYRFAMTETETRVFVNENPVPVMVFTPATGTNRHFRIGDGDSGANFGSDIDWIIWDVTGSHAPGEGTPVPFAELTPQWGIRLSDLRVGGTTVAGFHPAVVHYEVILPPDAVNPPLVAANAQLTSSSVVITQATAIPGTATIAVTSEDGLTTRTYSVHFRKRSSNANLATLTVGGTPLAGFNPEVTTYDIALPAGATAAPAIAATVAEWSSTLAITQATAVPGTGTVLVTAEDGTTRTYTLTFRHASTNANLASLMVGGTAIAGFSPTVTTYEVALPPATTVAPTVTATAADARATVVITQATAIPDAATVRVTAEDGTTVVTYTINFRLQSTNANLSNLMVGGTAVAGFNPDVTSYNVMLAAGTTVAPTVTAVLADTRAGMIITQAPTVPGRATVVVTAEAGNQRTYEVNFTTDPTGVGIPLESKFRVFPNPATTFLTLEWSGREKAEMEIINTKGLVVLRQTIDSQNTRIDIGNLPEGIYILRIRTANAQAHKTFIKQQ